MSPSKRAVRKSLRTTFTPDLAWRLRRARLRLQQLAHVPALVRGARLERPVFVVGAPRSGTTLLWSILRTSSHLEHWRPGEAHEIWEAEHHPALRGWASNVLEASDATDATTRRIRRSFALVAGSRRRLLDKTPRNALRVPFVDAIFPDALYVFLKRDGRDNVNSLINAWRTPRYRTYELPEPHAIPGVDPKWWKFVLYPEWQQDARGPLEVVCAHQWTSSNDHMMSAFDDIEPERWTEVRYEDLIERPVEVTEALMSFLELPFEPRLREQAAASGSNLINVVTPPERGKWRRENPREIESVLPEIQPTMKAMGYEE